MRNLLNLLNSTMTDPERRKCSKKGSTEERKKGKKVQSDNTANEQEAPESLICNGCKGIFTDVNVKMICCNRHQKWYCTKCMNITDVFSFLARKEAKDIVGFVKLARHQPRKQLLKTNVLKANARNTQESSMKN